MKKISVKIFLITLSCALTVIAIFGTIAILRSGKIAKQEAEEKLTWMVKSYAEKFSNEFRIIDNKLMEIEHHIESTIDLSRLESDPNYLSVYEQELTPYMQDFADNRTEGISAWVYFDPKWSDSPHDIYFGDGNGDGLSERQEHIPFSYFNATPEPGDDKEWWYGPQKIGQTFWTNPYQWTLLGDTVIDVVSAAHPIYIAGKFICVVGTYYSFKQMQEEVSSIQVYKSGYAALFNEKLDVIIHPHFQTGTRFTSENLLTADGGRYEAAALQMLQKDNGVLLVNDGSLDKTLAYAKLSNGWIMTVVPPLGEVYAEVYMLWRELAFSMLICILISAFVAFCSGKYLAAPILKLAAAVRVIGTGNLSVKVQVKTKDEVKLLADSINSMTSNIVELHNELFRQAYYDDLTGVRNLPKFRMDMEELLHTHPEVQYMLVKLDIQRFKMFNELYGFDEGDRILQNIATAINRAINTETDIFARISADEFIVLVACEAYGTAIEKKMSFEVGFVRLNRNSFGYRIVFKEGCYLVEPEEHDVVHMIEKVNLAHRLAKQSDLVHSYFYDETIRKLATQDREMEDQMERALEAGEFELYLQAKYSLPEETVGGAEALVRWKNSRGELLPPSAFIPLFERNGFITRLDFYMLEQVCKAMRNWADQGLKPVPISVNFSRRHIGCPDFSGKVCSIVDRYRIPRAMIEIELTETAMIGSEDILADFLIHLHKTGLKLSIDDFGTGYSSLGLLKNLPVDVVKLDRCFFMKTGDEERGLAVIESIIRMTKMLDIRTVAEGVEEEESVELLKRFQCDMIQGFYYARPIPATEFTELLLKSPHRLSLTEQQPLLVSQENVSGIEQA